MNIFTSSVLYEDSQINYFNLYLKTMIRSLILSNPDNDINLYIICDLNSKILIQDFIESELDIKSNFKINLVDNTIFERYAKKFHSYIYKSVIFYKILIPYLYQDLDRYLWLDSDTLTTINLNTLYNKDLTDIDYYGFADIELSAERRIFINTGVVLINCKEARKKSSIQKLINTYDDLQFEDEICLIHSIFNTKVINNIFYNYSGILSRSFHTGPISTELALVLEQAAKVAKIFHFYVKDCLYENNALLMKIIIKNNNFVNKYKEELQIRQLLTFKNN